MPITTLKRFNSYNTITICDDYPKNLYFRSIPPLHDSKIVSNFLKKLKEPGFEYPIGGTDAANDVYDSTMNALATKAADDINNLRIYNAVLAPHKNCPKCASISNDELIVNILNQRKCFGLTFQYRFYQLRAHTWLETYLLISDRMLLSK